LISDRNQYKDRLQESDTQCKDLEKRVNEWKRKMNLFKHLLELSKIQSKKLKDKNTRLENEIQLKIENEFLLKQSLDKLMNKPNDESTDEESTDGCEGVMAPEVQTTSQYVPVIRRPVRSVCIDCDYITFGTFRGLSRTVELNKEGITLKRIRMECIDLMATDSICVKWLEMRELLYCLDPLLPVIFVLPLYEASLGIKSWIDSAQETSDSEEFDTIAEDPKVRYIKIVLKTCISIEVVNVLKRYNEGNTMCECRPVSVDGAKKLLFRYSTRNTR